MTVTSVPIGAVAKASGVKVPTIRYYDAIGLLPSPIRTDGNRRLYDTTDMRRLGFIRHARELGFEIAAIKTLLSLQDRPDQPCEMADAVARDHLVDVKRRLASLNALKSELERVQSRISKLGIRSRQIWPDREQSTFL